MFGPPKMMESDGTEGATPHCFDWCFNNNVFSGFTKMGTPQSFNLDYCIYIVYSTYGFGVSPFQESTLEFYSTVFLKTSWWWCWMNGISWDDLYAIKLDKVSNCGSSSSSIMKYSNNPQYVEGFPMKSSWLLVHWVIIIQFLIMFQGSSLDLSHRGHYFFEFIDIVA